MVVMPLVQLNPQKQAQYMQLLNAKALKMAKELPPPILFDPQGRILIECKLSRAELRKAGFFTKSEITLLAQPKTIVSVDVHADKTLADKFYARVETALIKALSEPGLLKKLKKPPESQDLIEALKKAPKGSIISLQQEYHFHLSLAARVYKKSAQEFAGEDHDDALATALDNSLAKTNELIMRHYALALAQACKGGKIDFVTLNKEMDKARKAIAESAHRILRDEIRLQTGVKLEKGSLLKQEVADEVAKQKIKKPKEEPDVEKIREKLLTELAESTVASEHDLLHIDTHLGTATWIEGSKVTAHDRHIMEDEDELATRQIITHQLEDGSIIPFPRSRVQIRVPSLDAKSLDHSSKETLLASQEEHIVDVQTKLDYINYHYFQITDPKPSFFVYNLYTSLEHTLDDTFKDNLQTQGAEQILMGAHRYNAARAVGSPLCFVQNIPINGFGNELGHGLIPSKLVNEVTLMTDMALMHTLFGKDDPQVIKIREEYEEYLDKGIGDQQYFYKSTFGQKAMVLISKLKEEAIEQEKAPAQPVPVESEIVENAKAYLKHLVAHNLHYKKEYSKLAQTLSVFIEDYSIGGCKSANERAQAINGRVLMLDSLLITDPNAPLKDERHALIKALAQPNNPAALKAALDGAYNVLGLQSALALVSFIDQGAAAKGIARTPLQLNTKLIGAPLRSLNGNIFEEETLTHLSQSKSGAMQAHKGLTEKMLSACDDSHSEKLLAETDEEGELNEIGELRERLEEQLNDYSTYGKANGAAADDTGQDFVDKRLTEDAQAHLYDGIEDYEKRHYALIVQYCDKFKLPIPEETPDFFRKQFIELAARKKFEDFEGDKGKRKTNPESATQSLEEFFGKQGAALYKLALQEERYTKEYMNAVFQESTTHSEGAKWKTRPVVIVAGPSACGKSTAATAAIDQANTLLPTDQEDQSGNDIVAADGGVAREISQMRKLAIQVSVEHGFSGVEDLHSKSNVLSDVKDCILEAAYATESLGVVIPETFAKAKTSARMFERIDQLKNTTPIWLRVTGENVSIFSTIMEKISTTFREVVAYMGSRRAFKTSGFKDEVDGPRQKTEYDLNISKDDIPESKAYGGFLSFIGGWFGSLQAERNFKKHFKEAMTYTLVNDLILLKPGNPHGSKAEQWLSGAKEDDGVMMVSRTAYNAWLKDPSPADLKTYAKENRKTLIYTQGQFALIEAVKELEAQHSKAQNGTSTKVFLNNLKYDLLTPAKIDTKEKIETILLHIEKYIKQNKTGSSLTNTVEALEQRYRELRLIEATRTGIKLSEEDALLETTWKKTQTEQGATVNQLILDRKPIEAIQEALISLQKIKPTSSSMDPIVLSEEGQLLTTDLTYIAEECSRNLQLLSTQTEEITALMEHLYANFLPSQVRGTLIRTEVAQHRAALKEQLDELERVKNDILLPTQQILDLESDNGLIARIDVAAETGEMDHSLVSIFTVKTQDKSFSDLGFVYDYDEDLEEHGHDVSGSVNASQHKSIAALADGHYREHSVYVAGTDKKIGSFTEIHHSKGLASDKSAAPSVTYSSTRVENESLSQEEKVLAAFAMASKILVNLKHPPSKAHPITLNGYNKEKLEFLFTAIMILGGDQSKMRFDADVIRVRAIVFDPKKQLGRISRYSDNSCYNKHFKGNSAIVKAVVSDFNKLLTDKTALAQEQQTTAKVLTHTTHKYRAHLDELRGEVEVASPRGGSSPEPS